MSARRHGGRHRRRRLRRPDRRAAGAVAAAQVLVGGERHLAFFPQFAGERIVLKDGARRRARSRGRARRRAHVCVLASGDPLFFGIGGAGRQARRRRARRGPPAPSSVQWAFARAGLKWDDATVHLAARPRRARGSLTRLRRAAKVALLTDDESSPRWLAAHLLEHGERGWHAWVCENLGGAGERVRRFGIDRAGRVRPTSRRSTCCCWCATTPTGGRRRRSRSCTRTSFAKRMPKKGLITKREVRLALAGDAAPPARQRRLGHRRRLGLGGDRGGAAGLRRARLRHRGRSRGGRDLPRQRARARRRQRARRRRPRARGARRAARHPTPSSSAAARGHGRDHRRSRSNGCSRAAGWWSTPSRSRTSPRPTTALRGSGAVPEVILLQRLARRAAGALPALRSAEPDPHLRGVEPERHDDGALRRRRRARARPI